MREYKRALNIKKLLKEKSFFLFGPRSTGKSTLIRQQLPEAIVYDLLDDEIFKRLLERPKLLSEENADPAILIVIDEIQRLPQLLHEVHRLITKEKRKFLLTGSSARKLNRAGVNLLAGRAWRADFFPLTFNEIESFDLLRFLNHGGLPQVYLSDNHNEELKAYIAMYLRQEVQAESLTRNLQSFSHFLDVMALSNGEEVNFQSLSSDCGVSAGTLKNYIQILEDTLLGFSLKGFTATKKRKAINRIKHYFFDVGVVNSLTQRGKITEKTEVFGKAFEHFIMQEMRAYLSYRRDEREMFYWRSTSQFEVDLIVGKDVAIEIKGTSLIQDKHLKGLRALKEEKIIKRYVIVSLDLKSRKTEDGIEIFPWREFCEKLWEDRML
jgi:predicted AAA+ superfamily ATPase